jgi:23S rRNA (uracil1939-C5)-methyltransferase
MAKPHSVELHEFPLAIDDLAPTGEGIGRLEGMVVFVPHTLPGEVAQVEVVERKRSFLRARLLRVLTPSPARMTPPCKYFGRCGGCEWQHMAYAGQVAAKTAAVQTQIARVGGLDATVVRPCIPSPAAYGYRNSARLARRPDGRPAYRAAASNDLIAVDDCPILEPALNAQLAQAAAQGLPTAGEWAVRVPSPIRVGDFAYEAGPDAFFQVNTAIAARLVEEVLAAFDPAPTDAALDLYCGVGLFTLPLALRCAQVTGVEMNAAAARDARRNLAANRYRLVNKTLRILSASVHAALAQPAIRDARWDGVVVDPPRAGLDIKTRTQLLKLGAPKLVYVSCDPATLARDLQALTAAGYTLDFVQPLDMFPQTHHVESVALLRRR